MCDAGALPGRVREVPAAPGRGDGVAKKLWAAVMSDAVGSGTSGSPVRTATKPEDTAGWAWRRR